MYYIGNEDKAEGPYTEKELKMRWKRGTLAITSFVWNHRTSKWELLQQRFGWARKAPSSLKIWFFRHGKVRVIGMCLLLYFWSILCSSIGESRGKILGEESVRARQKTYLREQPVRSNVSSNNGNENTAAFVGSVVGGAVGYRKGYEDGYKQCLLEVLNRMQ